MFGFSILLIMCFEGSFPVRSARQFLLNSSLFGDRGGVEVFSSSQPGSAVKNSTRYIVYQLNAAGDLLRFDPNIIVTYTQQQLSLNSIAASAVNALLAIFLQFDFCSGTALILCMTKNICKAVKRLLDENEYILKKHLRVAYAFGGDDAAIAEYMEETRDDNGRRIDILCATSVAITSLSAMHCKLSVMLGAYSLSDVVQGSNRCSRGTWCISLII